MNSVLPRAVPPTRPLPLSEMRAPMLAERPRGRRHRLRGVRGPRLAVNPATPLAPGDYAHLKRVYD